MNLKNMRCLRVGLIRNLNLRNSNRILIKMNVKKIETRVMSKLGLVVNLNSKKLNPMTHNLNSMIAKLKNPNMKV